MNTILAISCEMDKRHSPEQCRSGLCETRQPRRLPSGLPEECKTGEGQQETLYQLLLKRRRLLNSVEAGKSRCNMQKQPVVSSTLRQPAYLDGVCHDANGDEHGGSVDVHA